MRSQWTDKATGKVINLSNYSFSQMSGWNGYNYDFSSNWMSDQASMLSFEKTQGKTIITGFKEYADAGFNFYINSSNPAMHVRLLISGLNGKNSCSIQYKANLDDTYTTLKTIREDGILEVDVPESAITVLYFHIYDKENPDAITIEQLPLYPGALVSDGVDDKIQAEEALGEVGSVLIHWKNIGLPAYHYLYNTGWDDDAGRLYCWNMQGSIACGIPHMQMDGHPIMIYHRSPLVSTGLLNNNAGENNCPIFRLIFIKEQLNDAQLDFLKWKVGKEYRDWCKENGYEYAISEMLNN